MICINECKGIPVISLKTGERLGYLKNALFDMQSKVKGFVIEGENSISLKLTKKCVFLDDILKLSKEICMIYSKDNIKTLRNKKEIKETCPIEEKIGKTVITENGKNIGVVDDVFFDIATGELEGLEISKGFMNDIIEGKNKIFINDGVEFAEEFVIAKGEIY